MRKLGPIFTVAAMLAMALTASATPIRPDIRKLVAEPSQETIQFAPARAGWNGSEAAVNNAQFTNPAVERLTPAAAAREIRASMLALAVPDWRIVLAILALIVLLRIARWKNRPVKVAEPTAVIPTESLRPAA
jgi:hypothetical protein